MKATFVIVGGGIAGSSCAETLARLHRNETIILINKSPLIKTVTNLETITRTLVEFDVREISAKSLSGIFPNIKVIHDNIVEINSALNTVRTEEEILIEYKYLCICTGAKPNLIPQASYNDYVLGIRDRNSLEAFIKKLNTSKVVAIVGNGGIATELIYKLTDVEVHWIIRDEHITANFIDWIAANCFQNYLEDERDPKPEPVDPEPEPELVYPRPVTLYLRRELFEPKIEPFDPNPEPLDPKPDPLDSKPEPLDPKPDPLDSKSEPLDPKPDPLDSKSEPLDPKPDPLDSKPEPLGPKPEPLDPKPKSLGPKPEPLESKPESLNPKPELLNPKPELLNPKPELLNPKPELLNPKPELLNPKPKLLNPKPEPFDPEPELVPKSEPFDSETELFDDEPKSIYPDLEPTYFKPEAIYLKSEFSEPEPEPEPIVPKPQIVYTKPEPFEPKPSTSKQMYEDDESDVEEDIDNQSEAALGPGWHKNLNLSGAHRTGLEHNVRIHYQTEIVSISENKKNGKNLPISILLSNDEEIECNFIVSATGVLPAKNFVVLGYDLDVEENGGIKVNEFMQTSVKNIYAAGDVCSPNWDFPKHWFPMKLWTQARQMGCYAAKCMSADLKDEKISQDISFQLFAHSTELFGYKITLMGLFNGQKLEGDYEVLRRTLTGYDYVSFIIQDSRMQGAMLIGDTDLEETCEDLILNQTNLLPFGEDVSNYYLEIVPIN